MESPRPDWIFFDVGWTLVDETRPNLARFEEALAAAPAAAGLSPRDLFSRLEVAVREDAPDPFVRVLEEIGLSAADRKRFRWNYDLIQPYRDAGPALRALRGTVKLGALANQGVGLPARLDRMGFAGLFDLVLGSSDCGFKKPDPAFFEFAAGKAGCPPDRIMMAGDRLDNDILPAKRAGWRTIWVRRGPHGKCNPRGPEETPDGAVRNLVDIASMFVPPGRIRLAESLDNAGAILKWPEKERDKRLVLEYLASRFEAGRDYAEAEVNRIIDAHHRFGDYALLRRELVDRGLLARDDAGRRYRRIAGGETRTV